MKCGGRETEGTPRCETQKFPPGRKPPNQYWLLRRSYRSAHQQGAILHSTNLLSEFAGTTALVPLLASWFSWTAHRFVPVQSWTSQGSHVRQSRRPRPVCSSPFGVQSVSCPTGVISRNGFCAIPLISAHTHGHAYSAILCFSSFWPISRTSSAGTQKGRSQCRVSVISSN